MEIKEFVKEFLKSRDINDGVYQSGASGFRAQPIFEDLLDKWEGQRKIQSTNYAIEIIEKYLNENFWIDHLHPNGYPTKVITKSDFMGMLNEIRMANFTESQIEQSKETPPSPPENVTIRQWI